MVKAGPARITMLDAGVLDKEVFSILKTQLLTALQVAPPWTVKQHELKLDILLHYILWKCCITLAYGKNIFYGPHYHVASHCSVKTLLFSLSLSKFKATFGQQLLNMQYQKSQLTSTKEKVKLLSEVLSYLHNNDLLISPSSNVNRYAKIFHIAFHLCELTNLLLFLNQGKYPSVVDRILGLRLVRIVDKSRDAGYNYMTRELIWHGFMELLTFTLSVVNYQYIRRTLMRFLFKVRKSPALVGRLHFTTGTKCSICSKPPILPQSIGCSHVFCYYCLQTNRLVDTKFECSSCGYFDERIEFVQK